MNGATPPLTLRLRCVDRNIFRLALFWVVTQLMFVVVYRRCGTTNWSHLQGINSRRRRLDREAVQKSRYKKYQNTLRNIR